MLVFTVEGVRVQDQGGAGASLLAWSGLDGATCTRQVVLPDGRGATVLELMSEGQSIHFLLPADHVAPGQAAYLAEALPLWLVVYRGTSTAQPVASPEDGGPWVGSPGAVAPGTLAPAANGAQAATRPEPSPTRVAPLGTAPASNGSRDWVPIPPPTGPFPPGPPGSGLLPAVGPDTGGGPVTAWVPPPPPAGPPVAPGDAETAFALGPALFQVRRTDTQPSWGTNGPDGLAWSQRADFGRRASDRPVATDPLPPAPPDPGDPAVDDEDTGRRRWGLIVVVVLALLAAAAGGYLFYRKVVHPDTVPATAPDVAKAAAVNLRLTDLPAGFSEQALPPIGSPPASVPRRRKALDTMASCLDVPLSSVQGWFGTGPFPQQITVVRSPTFGDPTVPTVQMFSSTALVAASDSTSAVQEAALGSPKFPACYGQYQVAALAVPVTGQVQTVPLTAPSGTKAYGFLTMFTLADGATELVGEAFILGSGVTTLLEASTDGPSIPPEYFTPAFRAVAGRVAAVSE